MKGLNYSSLTATLRRMHEATRRSEETGVPVDELLDQDLELRKRLQAERIENSDRRQFLRTAAGAAAGAGLYAMGDRSFAMGAQPSIAIIGGGAGGMRTAHRLMQYGIGSTVYEARDRLGGRIFSDNSFFSDGRVVEWGGELISTEHNAIRNLVHVLDLKLEDVNNLSLGEEETYFVNGTLYSEKNLLDEWVGGLYDAFKRALMEAPWQPLYYDFNEAHKLYDYMTTREFVENAGYPSGHWVNELMMTVMVSEYGLLDHESSALNLIYLLGYLSRNSGGLPLAGTDERFHVVGGNDQIIEEMKNQLPEESIERGRKLEAVVGDYEGPYELVFEDGSYAECDLLVFAVPYALIREIDIDDRIWTGFSHEKRDAIDLMAQSDNGKIQMEFTDRHWDMVQLIGGEEVHQSARAWSNPDKFISTWEGEPGNPSPLGILVDYNGGAEARSMNNKVFQGVASNKDVNRVLRQFENIWPGISAKYTGKALVSNWWDDPLSRGAFVSPTVGTMTTWWGAHWETEGNIYFAGEACDYEYWSYMNGAILSGERVATEIHQR